MRFPAKMGEESWNKKTCIMFFWGCFLRQFRWTRRDCSLEYHHFIQKISRTTQLAALNPDCYSVVTLILSHLWFSANKNLLGAFRSIIKLTRFRELKKKLFQRFGDLAILESPGKRFFFSKKAASAEALTDVGLMVILNNHVSSAGWSGIPTAQPLGDVI